MKIKVKVNTRGTIEKILHEPAGSSTARVKLEKVLCKLYRGDSLYFFAVASDEIIELLQSVRRNTPILDVVEIWADRQLAGS